MRIRRKKHLQERLKAVSDILFVADYSVPDARVANQNKTYFNFEEIYGNSNPVELEIGCGKGGFIVDKALLQPHTNFLAVELLDNIVVMASENAKKHNVKNVRFFNCGAEYLPKYIKDSSISNIYLNFSPPFNGVRYENRRLTNSRLIEYYKSFLVDKGCIYLKTDNKEFYDYSFSQFKKFGFNTIDTTEAVYSGAQENIKTEYELNFSWQN